MRKTCLLLLLLCLYTAFVWCQNPVACLTNQAPGAGSCADACLHCFLDGRTGQTNGYVANPAPGFCGTVENNQWFGFVAGAPNITITVTPSNCQSGEGLEIALYENCSDAPIACAQGQAGAGNEPRVLSASLVPGHNFFLMIDGFAGDLCSFQISVTPANAVAPPPHGSPGKIDGPTVVVPGSKLRYSIPSVPDATAYRWTAPSGTLINGQSSPVELAASTGNQVTVTFGSQDGALCVTPVDLCSIGSSCLDFSFVQETLSPPCPVDNFPASDLCQDACVLCNFNGYSGTTVGFTGQAPSGFCDGVQNEQWLAFIAGNTSATFTCTPSNCTCGNGIQMALYSSCNAAGPLSCDPGQLGGGQSPVSVSYSSLEPGVTYYLVIDGFGGDFCDFQLSVSPPNAAIAPPVGAIGTIIGPAEVCPGGSFNYSVEPVSGAGAYNWAGPPGCTINGMPSPVTLNGSGGNVAQVRFGAQAGPICVQAVNSCYTGTEVCKPVTVKSIPVTNLPPVTICAEDAPYYTPWGHECPTPGSYCTTLTTDSGCDSVVCIQVNIRAPIHFFHAPKVLCAGDSVVLCGKAFYSAGNHEVVCESYLGCDSTVHQLVAAVLDPVAEIIPSQNLLCADLPVVLNSLLSPGTKTWRTLSGQVLGNGNSITVTTPDTYVLTTVASAGANTCEASDTIRVEAGKPDVAVTGGTLTCIQPAVQLDATASPTGLQLFWTGPAGFTSDLEDPVVTQPGTYVLTATDTATGCSAQATAEVPGDFAVPVVSFPSLALNCTTPEIPLNCPLMPSVAECLWSGPGIGAPIPDPVITQGGIYLLTITNLNNGCTTTSELTVTADFQIPVITAFADTITCLNPTTAIHCETDIPMSVCDWSGIGPEYIVTATAPNGCTATATVTVPVDTDAPALYVSDDTLRCDQPVVTLFANTNVPNALFAWTGPGGFASSVQNPAVTQPGQYFVEVTEPVNGCTSTDQVEIVQDVQLPEVSLVQVVGDQNGQGIGSISISVMYTGSYAVVWYHNGNVIFNTENISGLTAGDYTVVVTGSNGCTGTLIVTVQDTGVSAPEKFDDNRWIVFPNPADSRLFVRYLGEEFPDAQLLLLDATGRTVSDLRMAGVSDMEVPCGGLPSGVYTLLILSRERSMRRMVMIQK